MKTYQSVLPATTRKTPIEEIGRRIKANLRRLFDSGFWYCSDCERVCERVEGEQGQPAHCDRCKGHRIEYVKPLVIEDRKVIQPGDLSV